MAFLDGKAVLVTGGTGSFGRHFVRRLLSSTKVRRVVVFSRDELKQFDMQQHYVGEERIRFFIGDVRDQPRLSRALHGIDYLVHAAALKQIPAAEYNPFEAVKTNIHGAQNIIEACIDQGVKRVIALSTDKASSPINLYGATKLVSDKLFVAGNAYAGGTETRFSVVRYGNVAGSRGSVVPFFKARAASGVLPITDPRMSRFWITLDQGVELVLDSLPRMNGGEIFVPKIPSMRVVDLAKAMAPEARLEIVGIRPGEKLHEEMISIHDARRTIDMGSYFVIQPEMDWWEPVKLTGSPVAPEFCYSSDTNTEWLSVERLREMLQMSEPLPYGRQWIDEEDVAAVSTVIRGDFLTTGPAVGRFEGALAASSGARFAVAVNSGTAALHAAYFAAGLRAGDEIITSPLTFAATANAALYLGASVRFADVDPGTGNLDPDAVEALLTPRTRLIVPVDFAGHPADYDRLRAIARRHGTKVVADAAHSLGASLGGRSVGTLADLTATSFHPVKPVTTGEGGAVLTDDPAAADAAARFRSHGIVRDPERMVSPEGPWYYEQHDLGFNYRLTDIQCALGASQVRRLPGFIARRRAIAASYADALRSVATIELPIVRTGAEPGWHLFVVRVRDVSRRRAFFDALRASGLGVQVHYIPVYYHPYYAALGFQRGSCPVAEAHYSRSVSIPIFPRMTDADVARVVESVTRACREVL